MTLSPILSGIMPVWVVAWRRLIVRRGQNISILERVFYDALALEGGGSRIHGHMYY